MAKDEKAPNEWLLENHGTCHGPYKSIGDAAAVAEKLGWVDFRIRWLMPPLDTTPWVKAKVVG